MAKYNHLGQIQPMCRKSTINFDQTQSIFPKYNRFDLLQMQPFCHIEPIAGNHNERQPIWPKPTMFWPNMTYFGRIEAI